MKRRVKDDNLEAAPRSLRRDGANSVAKLRFDSNPPGKARYVIRRCSQLMCIGVTLYALLYVYFELLLETDEWLFTLDDWNAISEKIMFEYGDYTDAERVALKELREECKEEGVVDADVRVKYYLNSWSSVFDADGAVRRGDVRVNTSFSYVRSARSGNTLLGIPLCFQPKYWEEYNQKLVGQLGSGAVARYRRDFSWIVKRAGLQNTTFLVAFGDGSLQIPQFPLLGKTRSLHDKSSVLLKLNVFRHFQSIGGVKVDDNVPFKQKRNRAVWRGATTGRGKGQRAALLKRLPQLQDSPVLDVGYNRIVQGANISKALFRRGMSRKRLLTYKMVIIAEGNDVSSGLKWALLSTSAVLMPPANYISWLMEDKLRPWVHYIPVRQDFSDLEHQALWCLRHVDECEQIGRNGRCFMRQFLDRESENRIQNKVMHSVYKLYQALDFPVCNN